MADMNKAGTPKQAPIVPGFTPKQHVGVGGEILSAEPIEYNEGRYTAKIVVHNTGDRPIQVGSHFHFFEVNRYLEFDRAKAFGCHLNIPAIVNAKNLGFKIIDEAGAEADLQKKNQKTK